MVESASGMGLVGWVWLDCIHLPAVRDTDWVHARFGHD